MRRIGRIGIFALLALGPAIGAGCAVGRSKAPIAAAAPIETAHTGDGGPCGGHESPSSTNAQVPADELANASLTRFASAEELAAMVRDLHQPPYVNDPLSSGGMWGDSIGDAFGAGGLGLSGIGEGGGGVQEFGMIGMLAALKGSSDAESVTNVQHTGVDEGGIVKVHGEHLLVLRRGRLFTVRIGDLAPVAAVDAFAAGTDPHGAWYDEMLVSGNTIAVVGYSYARGGTEIGLFDIDGAGAIRARATYHLRSNDYYSSRNYASRLVGNKLVFYTPLYVRGYDEHILDWMPAMRRWSAGAKPSDFHVIASPTQVWRPLRPVRGQETLALHTVTTCDLSDRAAMTCTARGVVAGAGRSFYVSPDAVYVWTSPWEPRGLTPSIVYRLPLDEKAEPTVLRAAGAPIDQFSFLEQDGHLNVVVRARAQGDAMWAPEMTSGSMSLLRVPVSAFSRRPDLAPATAYAKLPSPDPGGAVQNRFVGRHLVYGTGMGWGRPKELAEQKIFVSRYTETLAPTHALAIGHAVDRIEPMGDDAIAIGPDTKDLHFSSIALPSRDAPRIASRYTRSGATQGELRSHGFFYRPDGEHAHGGFVGLPIRGGGRPGSDQLGVGSAQILYVRNDGLKLHEVGALGSGPTTRRDHDFCVASCVDWYGNARPLFLRGRMLALLGYELVEGRIEGASGSLAETKRTSFSPQRR